MQYLFSDFYLLLGAADKGCRSVGSAWRRMSELMGIPVNPSCLLYALEGLHAGGFAAVTPVDGVITADTAISLTESGRNAVAVSSLQKPFGEGKALNRKELRFCSLERPAVSATWSVKAEDFSAASEELLRSRTVSYPLFGLAEEADGQLTLTLNHPARDYSPSADEEEPAEGSSPFAGDPDEAARIDEIAITGSAETILQGVSHLLETALVLMNDPRTRKVALHGSTGSYIVTLAHAATEYGTALRVTAAQIRFNRQRFYGKRDSDLDYAQCGSPLITTEMNGAREFAAGLLPCAVSLPESLGETERQIIKDIHRKLKA